MKNFKTFLLLMFVSFNVNCAEVKENSSNDKVLSFVRPYLSKMTNLK